MKKGCILFTYFATACFTCMSDAFEAEKLYRYKFEGTMLTKVANDEKPQYSGLSLSSPMLLKKTASNELTVRLAEPQIAIYNEVIEDLRAHKPNFKAIQRAGSLDKPFRIYYENGLVNAFDIYKDEPKWVTNFKRGLLSFFQLRLSDSQQTLDQQYYTSTEKSVFGECETDYLVLSGMNEQQVTYLNVTKTRNMAKCKTRFLHKSSPVDSTDCYENEKELQQYKHSNAIFNHQLIGERKNYVIEQVRLDEVTLFSPFGQQAHSHQVKSEFTMKLERTDSSGSRELAVDDSSVMRIESLSYDPSEMVNFYANINLDEEHYLSNIYQVSANVEQVMEVFDALVAEHKTYTSDFEAAQSIGLGSESPLGQLFFRLNELVGTLSSQKIEQLYGVVDERGDVHKKIFWDLMSVVGTNPSFMFMKKLITEGDAPSVKIRDFLSRLSFHIKMPSKSLFDEYVNLCKSDKIQTNQAYKRLCSLPLASLIHQHCAKPHSKYLRSQQEGTNATSFKKAQNTCQMATADEYFSRLIQPLGMPSPTSSSSSSSSSPSISSSSSSSSSGSSSSAASSSDSSSEMSSVGNRMFTIKMAGELGVRPSIEFLMDFVRNRDEHPSIRGAAMWSLAKVAKIYPNQVKRLVVPYYYDQNELLEVRLAAFHDWLMSGISLHELETVARQLMEEPSRQLVIYMNSLIKSLSELDPIPCSNSMEKNAKLVLPAFRRALKRHGMASLTDSQAVYSSYWNSDFGYGSGSFMSVIFSNESMAPSSILFSSSEIMNGLKLSPLKITLHAHGLDKLIKRVTGINGLLADKESFMDVFSLKRRAKRQIGSDPAELVKQEAAEIDKELKLGTREFSDVYLAVSVSVYGRIINFFDRDSRELKKLLGEDGTIKIPQIKKVLHSFNNHTTQQMMINFEKLEVFNNELGLPLYQSISDFDFKTFKLNSIKMDVEPAFFKDERQGKPPTKLSASFEAKLGMHKEIFVSSGALLVNSRELIGVGFHKKKRVNTPLKMSLEANMLENKLTLKRQPIFENLLHIKQGPMTFIRSYEPLLGSNATYHRLPLYQFNNTLHMKPFNLEYMTPLALGLRAEGSHRVGEDWSMNSWRRHLTEIGFKAAKFMYTFSPTGAPMEMRISTYTTNENPTKELTSVFSWIHHHDHQSTVFAHSQELNEIERELEQFTSRNQVDGSKPSSVNYKLALLGGSEKERKVSLDINYSRSPDRLLHKWRAFYQRSPLEQFSPAAQTTNLCWIGQLQFPSYNVERFLKFDILNMDNSANMSSELTFGDQCNSMNQQQQHQSEETGRVSAQFFFDWNAEQREQIEAAFGKLDSGEQLSATRPSNPYLSMYKSCMRAREQTGAQLAGVCVHLLHKLSELTHVNAIIDYNYVPDRWTKLASRVGSLYTLARASYQEELDYSDEQLQKKLRSFKTPDGKLERAYLEANLTSSKTGTGDRKLSYEFHATNRQIAYRSLPAPWPPLSTFPLMGNSYYDAVRMRASSRLCTISGNSVNTFDNLTYTMPPISDGCFKLLAKDCSPEANYALLSAKIGTGQVVKVYVANKFKIEFVPDKEGKHISDIKVNGATVDIQANKMPLEFTTVLGARNSVKAFTIEYNGAYYTLDSKLYKFSVSTDGTWILVRQSKYYAGKSCGLCGDSNGDQLLEFKSPSSARKVCKTSQEFVWSYVLPSTCASRPTSNECA